MNDLRAMMRRSIHSLVRSANAFRRRVRVSEACSLLLALLMGWIAALAALGIGRDRPRDAEPAVRPGQRRTAGQPDSDPPASAARAAGWRRPARIDRLASVHYSDTDSRQDSLGANDDQHASGTIFHSRLQIDTGGPDVDVKRAAMARGVTFGCRKEMRPDQAELARQLVLEGKPISAVARTFNVHP